MVKDRQPTLQEDAHARAEKARVSLAQVEEVVARSTARLKQTEALLLRLRSKEPYSTAAPLSEPPLADTRSSNGRQAGG